MENKLLSYRYKKALDLVADLFKEEKRKVTKVPYIVHLVGVAHIVSQVTDDEDVIIAALLHDVLEDIPAELYSETDMVQDYGQRVTDIVKAVTHNEARDGYEGSREQYLKQISAGSKEACMVSGADLLYNLADSIDAYNISSEESAGLFTGKRADIRLKFYMDRAAIITEKLGGDHQLSIDLNKSLKTYSDISSNF